MHRKKHCLVLSCLIVRQVMPFDVCRKMSLYDTTTDDSPFFDNDMPTMRSSSSSSEGLPHVIGLNWEGSVESNEVSTRAQKSLCLSNSADFNLDFEVTQCISLHQDSDQCKKSSSRRVSKGHHLKCKSRLGSNDAAHSSGLMNCGMRPHVGLPPSYTGPKACPRMLTF